MIRLEYRDNGPCLIGGFESSLRVLTEEKIQKMSEGGFKLYYNKVRSFLRRIRREEDGITSEAFRALDYLRHACKRAKEENWRNKNE